MDGGMGFRDFEAFNIALLAKQWWRLVHNEKSLSFRVLKARYFPYCSPSEAQVGSNSSLMWRSLLRGRDIVNMGSFWRVGDGEKIDVWRDKWILDLPSYCPSLPGNQQPTPMKVSHLIDTERRCWKNEMLHELFQPEEVDMIQNIHLSRLSESDRLIWCDSELGNFTVKSAYFKARTMLGRINGVYEERSITWRVIWNSQVYPKVKLFIWRLFHNIIPTAENLRYKGIQLPNLCSVCGGSGENSVHVMFDCPFSKSVWAGIYPKLNETAMELSVLSNLWFEVMELLQRDGAVEKFMLTCWLLWKNRNSCLHEQVCKSPRSLMLSVDKLLADYTGINSRSEVRTLTLQEQWHPPSTGILKINTDAAFHHSSREAQLGVVGRDSSGEVCFCATSRKKEIHSPLLAELIAILYALQLAKTYDFKVVEVETDSMVAVKEINKSSSSFCTWGSIISDICNLLKEFEKVSISHIRRQCNCLAHNLAKLEVVTGESMLWWRKLPNGLCNPDLV